MLGLKLASPLYEAVIVCVPVSKFRIPLGVAVFPSLFNIRELPATSGRPPSRKVTLPVGMPCPDTPATSERKYTKLPKGPPVNGRDIPRSEERRVGKEC